MAEHWVNAAIAVLRDEAENGNVHGLSNQLLFEKIRQSRLVTLVYAAERRAVGRRCCPLTPADAGAATGTSAGTRGCGASRSTAAARPSIP